MQDSHSNDQNNSKESVHQTNDENTNQEIASAEISTNKVCEKLLTMIPDSIEVFLCLIIPKPKML